MKAIGVVEVPLTSQENRYNDSVSALGRISRVKCLGLTCFWSPDAPVYCVPTLITLGLVFGVAFTLWDELGIVELCVLHALLITAFVSSFLVTCTDPGVYPRLRYGEQDPFYGTPNAVRCRVCDLYRPPRTSHCYQCNVCVREHDHHCGIVGGCVGQRSMRWFALYLVTVGSATTMGVFWLMRSMFTGSFASTHRERGVNTIFRNATGRILHVGEGNDDNALKALVLVFLFTVLVAVMLLVGGLAIFYVFLILTSTTRRESQRAESKLSTLFRPKLMWRNLMHVMYPPPSMLIAPIENPNSIV